MPIVLACNSYGKSAVRLVKVVRDGLHHHIREFSVDVSIEGSFADAHTIGDNSLVLPTDTMKNTVYAMARQMTLADPETFARVLAEHFLKASAASSVVRITIRELGWRRLTVGGADHGHAFERSGAEQRVARLALTRDEPAVVRAGIDDLLVLKSGRSGFAGFPRDSFTTLRETDDRILATSIAAEWRYRGSATAFDELFTSVRHALLETFAAHDSKSVQHTLYAMAEAALLGCVHVDEITITMPNKHHLLVDLTAVGLENPNEIFVPTSEPYGLITATVRRG